MTVGVVSNRGGRLLTVTSETKETNESDGRAVAFINQIGKIYTNLKIGADIAGTKALIASDDLAQMGVKLHGSGFIVSKAQAAELLDGVADPLKVHIIPYRNGRDLLAHSRDAHVIDLWGLTETELRSKLPAVYQHVLDAVKPERDSNRDKDIRNNWWVFGRPRGEMRPVLAGLTRYIATVETAKHCIFQFLNGDILPDNMLIAIGLDDAASVTTLSSKFHSCWALASGGTLEDRPRYNKTRCFDPFPFPDLTDPQRAHLRQLGEDLDSHRKR